MLIDLIKLARPTHWIKAGFILVPVPFALASGTGTLDPYVFLCGFFGFCLLSSSIYAFNDLCDLESDRRDPRRQKRPLASGAIKPAAAIALSITCAVSAYLLFWSTGLVTLYLLGTIYLVSNIIYSLRAKHIPLVDVFILTSGFVLRVLVGCALVQATASNWLLLCSSTLALFLAFAKRRADLNEGFTEVDRGSLSGYNLSFLNQAMSISAGITLISYALYTQEAALFVPGRELVGLPFVAFAVLDYLRLVFVKGIGGSPTEIAYNSLTIRFCVLGWAAVSLWGLGIFDR